MLFHNRCCYYFLVYFILDLSILLSRPFQVAIHSFYYDDPFSSVSNLSLSLQEILLILLHSHTFSTCFITYTFSLYSVLILSLTSQLTSMFWISYILLMFLAFSFSHWNSPFSILILHSFSLNFAFSLHTSRISHFPSRCSHLSH